MNVADVNCQTVGELLSRWFDGALDEVDADLYEQHIVICPPCQRQNDKLRTVLAVLPTVADVPAGDQLVADLVGFAQQERAR